nr:nitrogen fixation protein NifH [uncultured Sphaerochaeta sp.]
MDWKTQLKADPIDWLLASVSPSIRYFTRRDILDQKPGNPQLDNEKEQIPQVGYVPALLGLMEASEYHKTFSRYYVYKYKGLVWSLLTLAELGAARTPAVEEYAEYLFEHAQERTDGGFAMHSCKAGGGRNTEVIPCLTGNLVYSLSRLGYQDDPRLRKALSYLVHFLVFNDGEEVEPQVPPYNRYEECWGKHTCHMAVVKSLKAFAAVDPSLWDVELKTTLDKAVEFVLIHHIHKRSHNLSRNTKPGWLNFGFPLMYQTDVLEILDILISLGVKDERMEEALAVVKAKQQDNGRWRVENTYASDRLLIPMGTKGEESEWVTLRALRVLKRYHQI